MSSSILDIELQNANMALTALQTFDLDETVWRKCFQCRACLQTIEACRMRMEKLVAEKKSATDEFRSLGKQMDNARKKILAAAETARQELVAKRMLMRVRIDTAGEMIAEGMENIAYFTCNSGRAPRRFYLVEIENNSPVDIKLSMNGDFPEDVSISRIDARGWFFSLLDDGTFQETPATMKSNAGLVFSAPSGKTACHFFSARGGSGAERKNGVIYLRSANGLPKNECAVPVVFEGMKTRVISLEFREKGGDALLPCKLKLTDTNGFSYVPAFDPDRDLARTCRNYFYCPGRIAGLAVPAGALRISAQCGLEHSEVQGEIPPPAASSRGESAPFIFEFARLCNMAGEGWHSVDIHTHALQDREPMPVNGSFIGRNGFFNGDTASHAIGRKMLSLAGLVAGAEDLDILLVLIATMDKGTYVGDPDWFSGNSPVLGSTKNRLVLIGQEYRHDVYGHLVLFGMEQLVPMDGRLNSQFIGFPPNAAATDAIHAEGGIALQAHSPDAPSWQKEIPVLVALEKLDGIEINNWNALDIWYRWLNCGFHVTPVTGTDSWIIGDNAWVGGGRTYVKTAGLLTLNTVMNGIQNGRTLVTSGPLLLMKVNGQEPGATITSQKDTPLDAEINIRVFSAIPLDDNWNIDLVQNGSVIATMRGGTAGNNFEKVINLKIKDSCWLAARCRNNTSTSQCFPVGETFAHTAPVYINLRGKPVRSSTDARFFVEYTKKRLQEIMDKGIFDSEAQKKALLELYNDAIKKYELLVAGNQ